MAESSAYSRCCIRGLAAAEPLPHPRRQQAIVGRPEFRHVTFCRSASIVECPGNDGTQVIVGKT
jgi:hypothetical protein